MRGRNRKIGQDCRSGGGLSLVAGRRPPSGCVLSSAFLFSALCPLLVAFCLVDCLPPRQGRIVVGSKNFTEQAVLGEILAQQIENRTHLAVERRFYLAGTYICQQSILAGRIDVYPEYTGTALTAILKQDVSGGKDAVY